MNRYQDLIQRIESGERILIDGATGSEIERRGVPVVSNAWNGLFSRSPVGDTLWNIIRS